MTLGERLKQARLEAGLSQRQLCGEQLTRNMLSQIESGKAKPSMQTLAYLAQTLKKPISWFLEEETVTSPNQQVMAAARQSYSDSQYLHALERLESYREPDAMFDRERWLLKALCLMKLAGEAIAEGKTVYARTLLEKAGQAGEKTVYYTPALERERLLLLYTADPESVRQIHLPRDDRELLLRAQTHLAAGEFALAAGQLAAAAAGDEHYHYLYGQALLGQGEFSLAAMHFKQAYDRYPKACAGYLEQCYRELEDYKQAYYYACLRRE